jgi:hypothetical protein
MMCSFPQFGVSNANRFVEEVCFAGSGRKTRPQRCFYEDCKEISGCRQQNNERQNPLLGCLRAEMFQFENGVE